MGLGNLSELLKNVVQTPGGADPAAQAGAAPGGNAALFEKITKVLAPMLKQFGQIQAQMQPQGQARGSPGQVGGAPPAIIPQNVPPGGAARAAPALQQMPGSKPYPAPGGYETGFEFRTKGGARAATVSGAVSNIMQSISRMKQQAEDRKRTEAQNIMSVLLRAYENPDDPVNKRIIQTIMSDPKKQKVLREIYGSVVEAMKPGETSPEAVGAQQAVKEAQQREQQGAAKPAPAAQPQPLFMPGATPQARLGAEQARTGEMAESVKQKMMQQGRGPEMLGASPLGREEQHQAARYAAGFELSPVQKATLDARTQMTHDLIVSREITGALARQAVLAKAVIDAESREKVQRLRGDALTAVAKLSHSGTQDEYNKNLRALLAAKKAEAGNLRNNYTSLLKADKDDEAAKFLSQAQQVEKEVDDLQGLMETKDDELLKYLIMGESSGGS
jgi:hypothetical protein